MSKGPYLRKYGAATTLNFDLFEVDGVDFRVDAVHAAGDTVIMKDEGAEANTTNGFTDEGTGYSIVLTATEMQAARIKVYVIDQTATKVWLDTSITIETYGNASAQHAVDLDDSVRAGLTALPNAAADAAGGLVISDAGGLDADAMAASVTAIEVDTGTTLDGKIDTIDGIVDAILVDTAEIGAAGAGLTNINLPNQTMDIVGNITGNLSGSVGSVTGAVGSVTGAVGSVTAEVTADMTKINGDATAAANLEASTETIVTGSVSAGTHTTALIDASDVTGQGDDTFIGRVLIFRTGTLQYESGAITDFASATGQFTFAANTWTSAPTSGDTFVIV